MKKQFTAQRWYKLDNAAKIFPGQNTNTWSNIFRLTAELKEPVQPRVLEQALEQTLPRFPCYKVRMRSGFFWHYLADNPHSAPPVMQDIKNPCHRIKFNENRGFLFRPYYHGNRVSIDIYHALSDGHGNAVFLCSVLAQYYRLLGEEIPCGKFVLDINEPASKSELEDSFKVNATSAAKYKRTDKFVYHASGTKLPRHMVNITSGTVSFEQLHKITAARGVTVTEYLAAVLLKVHYEKQLRESRVQKEVSVQIPINLRKAFGSDTLRNFTICLRTKIDPNKGEWSFEELLRQVSLQLRLANTKNELNTMITANMKLERNRLMRLMPLVVKDLGVGVSFLITGEQTTTALLTNLGPITLPQELSAHLERFVFMPGPGKLNAARCGVCTLGDKLVISFASIHEESDIEREFFTFLVKAGLHVKIESNR